MTAELCKKQLESNLAKSKEDNKDESDDSESKDDSSVSVGDVEENSETSVVKVASEVVSEKVNGAKSKNVSRLNDEEKSWIMYKCKTKATNETSSRES